MSESGDIRWVLLHTKPGKEDEARQNLLKRVQKMDVADWVGRVLLGSDPSAAAFEVEPSGTLLVELRYDPKTWHVVRETPGVTGFLGDLEPVPLQRKAG